MLQDRQLTINSRYITRSFWLFVVLLAMAIGLYSYNYTNAYLTEKKHAVNTIANMLQNDAWLQPALKKPPVVDQLFIVCALPLYHIFALSACFLLTLRAGGTSLLIPNPRDIPGFIKEMKQYRIHSLPAVNTLYNALLHAPGFDDIDFTLFDEDDG